MNTPVNTPNEWADLGEREADCLCCTVVDTVALRALQSELPQAWVRGYRLCAESECGSCYTCAPRDGRHRNPYLAHENDCTCSYCYSAAMGGGK